MSDQVAGRPRTIQTHIETLMRRVGGNVKWSPNDVWTGLSGEGRSHSVEHVTVALGRMVERGVVIKVGYGMYQLPGLTRAVAAAIHYNEVPAGSSLVCCSMCGSVVSASDEEKIKHTRFHTTWTR